MNGAEFSYAPSKVCSEISFCSVVQRAPCMVQGKCKKGFPKTFWTPSSSHQLDGYPVYLRRDDGPSVKVRGVALDKHYVVPYNPWLCHKNDCHLNVEICSTVASVKYLYKYVYKRSSRRNTLFV
uniref:Uncharacterized protein n=1 Tax=Anopheles dirus TaxID=7168 RepID=A0A182NV08_9DIPT